MARRSYEQNCALAIALDLIGERWTLLIIRELLIAPRRYRGMLENLPGIGTNLLADRLTRLSEAGLIEKQNPEHPHSAYRLTESGLDLEAVVETLVRFGMRFPDRRSKEYVSRPEWNMLALRFYFDSDAAKWEGRYELWLDEAIYTLEYREGLAVSEGPAESPIATIRMSTRTAAALAARRITVQVARTAGDLRVSGDDFAVRAFFDAFAARDE